MSKLPAPIKAMLDMLDTIKAVEAICLDARQLCADGEPVSARDLAEAVLATLNSTER